MPSSATASEKVDIIVEALDDKHALDIDAIPVEGRTLVADYFILTHSTSSVHQRALADGVVEAMEKRAGQRARREGATDANWILLDYGDVVVHIFSQEARAIYDLESLWKSTEALRASDDDAHLFEAIKSGAQGYLLKDLEAAQFFTLLEGVERGEPALTPSLARRLLAEFAHPAKAVPAQQNPDALTDREREVLELLVRGVTSNRKLAAKLGVSENTVKFHLRNILDKLHLNNRAQVVSYALRHHMVELPEDGG